ncbi:RnfABCDGE type electron transport complex subunit B [bacterium]|nr:RnfABCDGE type electron transport complex subunit B [bacterium]RQV92109.1 MAG: RnfABCDGE type electron transport complex subunit B [bacterium]
MDLTIVSAVGVLGGLGFIFGIGLALASKIFYVPQDHRIKQIEDVLPGINCGACGAAGCSGFAEGIIYGKYPINGCMIGGTETAVLIANILGIEAKEIVPKVAVVRCHGDQNHCVDRALYQGVQDCRAAVLINNGAKGCVYGCLGLGSCVAACSFDAIFMGNQGLPIVDDEMCTGCGECVRACPRNIMELITRDQMVYVACMSKDFGKAVTSVCRVGCIGCGLCANPKVTQNGIITMDGKLPVIHYDKIKDPEKDLENAVNQCPTKSFGVRLRESSVPVQEKEGVSVSP